MMSLLLSILCLCCGLTSLVQCEIKEGSVILVDGNFLYKDGILDNAIAYGTYNDSIETTGWGVLDITATTHNKKYTGDQIMFAAGMLEGVFTSSRIYEHYENLGGFLYDNRPANTYNKTCEFFSEQEKWMKTQIASHKGDIFWDSISFMQSQLEGLYKGYNITGTDDMTMCDMQILSGIGDMIDLVHVFRRTSMREYLQMRRDRLRRIAQQNGHCSALVKVTPGYENIYMGHSSWFVYSAMLRIYKHYDLQVFGDSHKGSKMSFSSYPGFLNSLDDFYILGSGMVMLQTTNNVYNTSLYDLVTPESIFAWYRVRVANLLATTGKEWGDIMKMHNSGTYNNQYMIMDLKKFKPMVGFEKGAFYVVEQIPGLVESHDQTDILREGYWASYNVPYYETIYNMSGYVPVAARDPDQSHDLAPRAKIFRRDQGNVGDMDGMKNILRFNDYKNDKYSEKDPCNSICCRGDLRYYPSYSGCYDTKVTDYFLAQNFTAFGVSGPTIGGQSNISPFQWTSRMRHHEGMPDVYNFPFVTLKPKYF